MLRVALAGLRARKFRLIATAMAIVLGVGFVAGTLIFSDTAKAGLYDSVARFGRNVDVVAQSDEASALAGPAFDPTILDAVRGVDGVAAASGRMSHRLPVLDQRGKLLGNAAKPGTLVFFGDEPSLRPFDLTAGRLPAARGEAALETKTAERGDFAVGDTVTVLDATQGRHPLTVVGIVGCGSAQAVADDAVVLVTEADLAAIAGETGYYSVVATAADGVSQRELAERIRAALPATPERDLRVSTGKDFRFDLVNTALTQFEAFLYILMIFAGIACVVAVFVIYNTFTILIAQRIRETALLRCVGADRRQVFGAVLLESVVVGLLGSAAGFALGVGIAYGLSQGMGALGLVAEHPLVLTATPVGASLLIGTLATLVSALVPALRATRISPLAALGTVAVGPVQGVRRRLPRIVLASAIALAGTGLTVLGTRQDGISMTPALLVIAGGVLNFLAVLVAFPLVVGPLIAAIGWLPGRLLGMPARLAVANARRAPGRTAATTAALMIGIGLIAAASVATATVKATVDRQITTNYPVDYMLRTGIQQRTAASAGLSVGLPIQLADRLGADPAFSVVARIRSETTTIQPAGGLDNGGEFRLASFEPEGLAKLPAIELRSGSMADLRDGTIIVSGDTPVGAGRTVGDTVRLTTASGLALEFTIVGLANGYIAAADALISWSDMAALRQHQTDNMIFIRAADGVSPVDSRTALLAITDDYPLAAVNSVAEVRAEITSVINATIMIITGLLGFAIIIALIGIMNTLSLSVLERTRESATVRALGLTRGQLRATLFAEAMLMALVGALVGSGLGLLYGQIATGVLFPGITMVTSVPVGQLLLQIGLAATAGVIAAVLPARKAAKASVVTAMADG